METMHREGLKDIEALALDLLDTCPFGSSEYYTLHEIADMAQKASQ